MQCESLWVRSAFVLILVIGGCNEIPRRTDAQRGTDYNTVSQQLKAAVQSMGVTAPLLVNETGSCLSVVAAADIQNELNWWDAMVHASVDLGIGVTAYYWMSDSDLGRREPGHGRLARGSSLTRAEQDRGDLHQVCPVTSA